VRSKKQKAEEADGRDLLCYRNALTLVKTVTNAGLHVTKALQPWAALLRAPKKLYWRPRTCWLFSCSAVLEGPSGCWPSSVAVRAASSRTCEPEPSRLCAEGRKPRRRIPGGSATSYTATSGRGRTRGRRRSNVAGPASHPHQKQQRTYAAAGGTRGGVYTAPAPSPARRAGGHGRRARVVRAGDPEAEQAGGPGGGGGAGCGSGPCPTPRRGQGAGRPRAHRGARTPHPAARTHARTLTARPARRRRSARPR